MSFSSSVHQAVDALLLFLFNWLSKLFAINEFSYVAKKKKYYKSNVWHRYSKIWNYCITYFMAYITIDNAKRSLLSFAIEKFIPLVTRTYGNISFLGVGISTLTLFRKRRNLRKTLNMFVSLQRLHWQFFGGVANISLTTLVALFLLNCISMYYRSDTLFKNFIFFLGHCRTFVLYFFVDVSMILHLTLIRSLASYLELNKRCTETERTLCVDFFSKLVCLRENIQAINWPIFINRLVLEILWSTIHWKNLYFVRQEEHIRHIAILVGRVCASNMINILYMAKNINRFERKIFDVLYERELFATMKQPEKLRNLRFIKVS